MTPPCFECGNPSDINHHVVPESLGGTKTVPLCNPCHSKVHDAKLISTSALTKRGLAAAKARGVLLGSHRPECRNLNAKSAALGRKLSAKRRTELRIEAYKPIATLVLELRRQGYTLQQIASHLNRLGHSTRKGRPFQPVTVLRIIDASKQANPTLF